MANLEHWYLKSVNKSYFVVVVFRHEILFWEVPNRNFFRPDKDAVLWPASEIPVTVHSVHS